MAGGIFTSHPQGPNADDPGCETCFWATVKVDDPSTPMTRHLPLSFDARDELYNFDRNPRLTTHVLTTLDESSYQGNYNISNAGGTMPADHPISWCQNYDGGRAYTQALGHLRERWYDQSFLQSVLQRHPVGGRRRAGQLRLASRGPRARRRPEGRRHPDRRRPPTARPR